MKKYHLNISKKLNMIPLIKNQGAMQTIINNNNTARSEVHQMNWDADYDGKLANISVNLLDNNKLRHYHASLNNNDLEELLNIPSVQLPLDKRLIRDFQKRSSKKRFHSQSLIEIPSKNKQGVENIDRRPNTYYTHLSSPSKDEEIVIPLNSELLFKPKTKKRQYRITKYKKRHTRKNSSHSKTSKGSKKSVRIYKI